MPYNLVPRIITRFGVRVQTEGWGDPITAAPVNLSEKGVCISLDQGLKKGTPLLLEIDLIPNSPPFKCKGIVAWNTKQKSGSYYCGIGIQGLTEEQVKSIREYVQKGARTLLKFFSEFPLFDALSEQDCLSLLRIITLHELDKKEVLYYEGDEDEYLKGLFIIESGLLGIYKGRKTDPEKKLAVVSAGQIFGETSLVTDQPHSATIAAVNPSRLIQISKVGYMVLRQESPDIGLKIMDIVARTLTMRLGRTTKLLFSPVHFSSTRR
ncbi:MAG: cyclic nucleotide-binding domain-containing protein [Sedimentisphaerales bacterium]|nr:cyclic nucleotide-binding domain-containing protein [Sedimentisphaerales bacterium]